MSEWISVEERLPDDGEGSVLFIGEHPEDPHYGSYCEPNWYCEMRQCGGEEVEEAVTHWMPLPAPPKESDDA